jgi:hypothetical protein
MTPHVDVREAERVGLVAEFLGEVGIAGDGHV